MLCTRPCRRDSGNRKLDVNKAQTGKIFARDSIYMLGWILTDKGGLLERVRAFQENGHGLLLIFILFHMTGSILLCYVPTHKNNYFLVKYLKLNFLTCF